MLGPAIDRAVGTFTSHEQRVQYVNSYANLVARIDGQIAPIVEASVGPTGGPPGSVRTR
jgi:hypothetical protein